MPDACGCCSTTRRRRDKSGGIRHDPDPQQRTPPLVVGGGDPEQLHGLTRSTTTASQRHRGGHAPIRSTGGAHACRRRDYVEEVTSRSVAEEPTMMATRESEIGSLGHDGVVRRARGVQGGESRAPAAPWRVSGPRDIIRRCTANSRLAGGCVAANFWRPQLSRWPFRQTSENGCHCCRVL